MPMPDDRSILICDDADTFDAWLREHHGNRPEIWVRLAKKGSPTASITRAEALDVALCWGWIDSQARRLDEHFTLQRYSPRRKASPWSQVNIRRAAELISQGRMRPSGQAQIDAAKADGRWTAAYAPQSEATVPPELAAAFDRRPEVRRVFQSLPRSEQYQIILGLERARTERGRATRLKRVLADLEARPGPPS